MNKSTLKGKLMLAASMAIFGTIGIFRTFLPLPSGLLAASRAVLGVAFLLLLMLLPRMRPDKQAVKQNFKHLILCGGLLASL